MSSPPNRFRATLAVPALLLGSAAADAQCTLDAVNLTFDNYNAFSTQDTLGAGYVYVTCDSGVQYTITLSTGISSTYMPRTLVTTGGAALKYNLTSSPGSALVWDNGTSVYAGIGTGTRQGIPVYGRIAAGQTQARVGLYSDTITATLTTR
ncbi:MAG TPA: spore coat U domain-containing protein [Steroidobacteraceae bacterium]